MAAGGETYPSFEAYAVERGPALAALARVLCGHRELAEDVLQEVLIRVCRQWQRVAVMEHRDAYVRRMLVNEHLSWRRRYARQVLRESAEQTAHHPDPAAHVSDHAEVVALVATLPPRQRTAVVLRYFGDLSDVEIAQAMGCSASAVRSYLTRALAALRLVPSDISSDISSDIPSETRHPVEERP